MSICDHEELDYDELEELEYLLETKLDSLLGEDYAAVFSISDSRTRVSIYSSNTTPYLYSKYYLSIDYFHISLDDLIQRIYLEWIFQ